MAKLLTFDGQVINSTAYIYIYAVKSVIGPRLAVFKVNNWAKFVFLETVFVKKHYKIGVSAHF